MTDLGERALHTVPRDDDAIPLVGAPALKELSGQAALHHARGGHHHAGPDVVEVIHALGRDGREKHVEHQASTTLSLLYRVTGSEVRESVTRLKGAR